jgi:hypothetical protein
MNNVTIIKKGSGTVECRICGLNFVSASDADREQHEDEHRRLICGGLPLKVREFLKSFGWAVAHNDGGIERQKDEWEQEIGKRAVEFGFWTRALSNGIPENDYDRFMAAHFMLWMRWFPKMNRQLKKHARRSSVGKNMQDERGNVRLQLIEPQPGRSVTNKKANTSDPPPPGSSKQRLVKR